MTNQKDFKKNVFSLTPVSENVPLNVFLLNIYHYYLTLKTHWQNWIK